MCCDMNPEKILNLLENLVDSQISNKNRFFPNERAEKPFKLFNQIWKCLSSLMLNLKLLYKILYQYIERTIFTIFDKIQPLGHYKIVIYSEYFTL